MLNILKSKTFLIFVFFIAVGIFFRLWNIEFGLPHSFHADEPEIAEFAIKYTFEFRDIIATGQTYRLVPISYVYGTFPVYFFTPFVMLYSKLHGVLGLTFEKMDLYVFMRTLNALVSTAIIPLAVSLYFLIFRSYDTEEKGFPKNLVVPLGAIFTLILTTLNWKLIVHAHYLNVDIIVTVLVLASFVMLAKYVLVPTKFRLIMSAVFFGLAFGTKVTALLSLPLILLLLLGASRSHLKENNVATGLRRSVFWAPTVFVFVMIGAFIISNPFALSFGSDWGSRIYTLTVKENGLVFDSVDNGTFKYIYALNWITTPLVFLAFVYGTVLSLRRRLHSDLHWFFISNIVLYLAFYTIGTRRVDRWLLPVLPLVLVYASYGLANLKNYVHPVFYKLFLLVTFGTYTAFAVLLLFQFQKDTPKSASYIWGRDNLSEASNKLAVTKEGLDPLNKLRGVRVINYEVYESLNAQFQLPESPEGYEYVFISSRPMTYFKNPVVAAQFPWYSEAWQEFENTLLDETKFELINSFTLPKPNLVELDDVHVYKNLSTGGSL